MAKKQKEKVNRSQSEIATIEIKRVWAKNKTFKSKLGVKDDEMPIVEKGSVKVKSKLQGLSKLDKFKLRKNPQISFFICMYFSNGTCKEFIITSKSETFTYKERTYYLRYEDSWFNLTQNQYQLSFFDDYPVPINRTIKKDGDSAFFSVTPDNLKPLIEMNYVKVLANTQELDKYLKTAALMGIINMIMLVFLLLRGLG